jgi:hypothetical protein
MLQENIALDKKNFAKELNKLCDYCNYKNICRKDRIFPVFWGGGYSLQSLLRCFFKVLVKPG